MCTLCLFMCWWFLSFCLDFCLIFSHSLLASSYLICMLMPFIGVEQVGGQRLWLKYDCWGSKYKFSLYPVEICIILCNLTVSDWFPNHRKSSGQVYCCWFLLTNADLILLLLNHTCCWVVPLPSLFFFFHHLMFFLKLLIFFLNFYILVI